MMLKRIVALILTLLTVGTVAVAEVEKSPVLDADRKSVV